jgi:4'-phosphopantetheinyl transferase
VPERPDEAAALARGEVVVHRISLRVAEAERRRLEPLLADDERRRAERFRFADDRARFVVGRACLRLVLAGHGAGPAARLRFGYGARGKPRLLSRPALRFNLAHAGDLALVAVAAGREVGVDVERVADERDVAAVVARFFSRHERAELDRLSARDRRGRFPHCWCRKEAYVKARGDGLFLPLDSFDVAVEAPGTRAGSLLLATRPRAGEAAAWDLRDLAVGAGYAAALAVRGRLGRVRCVDMDVLVKP